MILAIDPGSTESGYCWLDKDYKPVEFGKISTKEIFNELFLLDEREAVLVVEMVASYGMAVGATTFETCVNIGAFLQYAEYVTGVKCHRMYRKDVKMALCGKTTAKDSNIVQSLVDRFSYPRHAEKGHGKGTKKDPGYFYGFAKDIWQAYALGVAWMDTNRGML